MDKLELSPDQDGYSFRDGLEVLRAYLETGAGRYSRNVLNAALVLTVKWTLDEDEYEALRGAYNTHVDEGHAPFAVDLFIDSVDFVEHKVKIVPGTFGLSSHAGRAYVVEATLEVQPQPKATVTGSLPKLTLPPDKSGYAFKDTPETYHQPLPGGLGRTRRSMVGSSTLVDVQWTTNPAGYLYLRGFYRDWVTNSKDGFPIDLFKDNVALEEFTAQFVPGTMRLSSVSGHRCVVNAQLEIIVGPWPNGEGQTPPAPGGSGWNAENEVGGPWEFSEANYLGQLLLD